MAREDRAGSTVGDAASSSGGLPGQGEDVSPETGASTGL